MSLMYSDSYHEDGAMYTMRLGELIANEWDIGLRDYPIFQEEYREELNKLIIEQYYFREIGQETPEMFKRLLNRKMRLEMPYFNQMYLTQLRDYDPMSTMDMRTDSTNDTESTSKRAEESNAKSVSDTSAEAASRARNVTSDTPVTQLSGAEDYATGLADALSSQTSKSAVKGETDGSTSAEDSSQSLAKALSRTYGYSANPNELLQSWRDTITNVDALVIEMLNPLFMGVFRSDYGTL